MAKHKCPNAFHGDGARGACYFEIETGDREGVVNLGVGWSCVRVHDGAIPVSWLAELIAIATAHNGGIAGFLKEQKYGGSEHSYALECDPAPSVTP
jgi:hypothetical protein